ncbi:MAG: RagB/SusD family nutrient uptake outer membrane protein [Chitinophagaceae bacterium]|nr:RagB/SusD family nutrient uptake outer membrane protein [Chitinophagaceae bacterium]
MKSYTHIIVVAVAMLFSSCSKNFLDRAPLGKQTEDNFYSSRNAGMKTVVNCYMGFNNFWNFQAALVELGNMASDESEKGGSDAGDRPFAADLGYGRALSSNETLSGIWAACYSSIGNCNAGLDNLPKASLVDATGSPVPDADKARYIAEIRFLRAWYYFDLARVFGGVPLVTKTLTTADRGKLPRATDAETFKFITDELIACTQVASLPSKKDMPPAELGRVSKEAVWATLARVYLFYAGTDNSLYALARDAAKKVIDANVYSLATNYQDLFLPGGYKLDENVWAVHYQVDNALGAVGSFTPLYTNPRCVAGYGFDCPTENLVGEYETGDPRLLMTVLDQGDVFPGAGGTNDVMDFTSGAGSGHFGRKIYLTAARRGSQWGWPGNEWTFYQIRYADVLLMYAEALLESGGDKNEAAGYINQVRHRANTSSHTDAEAVSRVRTIPNTPLPDVLATDDLQKAVRHERRVELGMEYGRTYDLIRWGTLVSTMHDFSTKPYANGRGAAFKAPASGRYLFPIPQTEIDLSGGSIKQNPGF